MMMNMKKTMLRVLALLVIAAFVVAFSSVAGSATGLGVTESYRLHPDEPQSGFSDDGFRYVKYKNYVEIEGINGERTIVFPAVIDGLPVKTVDTRMAYLGDCFPERLVFEEGIEAIGNVLLHKVTALKEVVFPNTLKVIGGVGDHAAFYLAASLEEVIVPYSVSLICEGAFHPNTLLKVYKGSYAHRWAIANGHRFEVITHTPAGGDVNGDGVCDSTDARLVLQYTVEKTALDEGQIVSADVDKDGEVNSTDARLVLQHVVDKAAVAAITAPKSFDTPLIAPQTVRSVNGEIVVRFGSGVWPYEEMGYLPHVPGNTNYGLVRKYGPVSDPEGAVQWLNEQVANDYRAKGCEGGDIDYIPVLEIQTEESIIRCTNYLIYYSLACEITTDGTLTQKIMA
ncbi:MAG: hypothetical protein E7549_00045 [Ruminococcaceae bacterium]|nr:hypothetical protein [Oscillospiraceae bacterium]